MTDSTSDPVSAAEIAPLLAWARRLSQAAAGPTERAAYTQAKTALLARITDQHPHTDPASQKDTL